MALGPGPGSVGVSIYAVDPAAGRWDRSVWDGPTWGAYAWQDVDCQVEEVTARWGVTDEAGILSLATAGEADIRTIDPARLLDPMNGASPYYGAIRPGTPIRIVGKVPGDVIAATAIVDEASYDVAAERGRIRAVDGIAYLAQAQVPVGAVLANTLRARVRQVVALVGLSALVPVEAEAVLDPDVDPPVSPHDATQTTSAWEVVVRACVDALWIVWLDPTGTLRFRSWGALPRAGLNLGCEDPDDLGLEWLRAVSTVEATVSADPIRNSVRAYSVGTTWATPVRDTTSVARYGPRPFDVERVVPDQATWAARILADRADAGLAVTVGEVRPTDLAELAALLALGLAGPSIVRIRDDAHGPLIDLDCGAIGATLGVTAKGWRWRLVTSIPRVQWESDAPPPEPPEPPPPVVRPYHTETRTYLATKDALLALTSGGAKYGAGAATTLPVGPWAGWTYRSLVAFATIPWTNVRRVVSANLNVRTTDQVRVGFGGTPKLQVRRITAAWSEGSASSPSGSNSVVWPGPSTTSAGAVTSTMPGGSNAEKDIAVSALVRAWAPVAAGGSGAVQYGLALQEISATSAAYTTEIWPRENATSAARPVLTVVLEIYD